MRKLTRKYVFGIKKNLIQAMKDVFSHTKCPFVILIDEWDCLFREYKQDKDAQKKYLDFLRVWLKDKDYVAMAYMTGILPIKKYGSHSALNMFTEYSMTTPVNWRNILASQSGKCLESVKSMG
ncbi:MAG: AAA family ATPase [Lachnospiraceae bacterium]